MEIIIKKGLDIPIQGIPTKILSSFPKPKTIALKLDTFENVRFKVLVKLGDKVKIGTPLAENKAIPGQMFVSPACGEIIEIPRGLKRRLLGFIIKVDEKEEYEEYGTLDLHSASKEDILHHLNRGGIFPHIRMRPFNIVANRKDAPRDIFVKAIESLPFVPSAELQVDGHEKEFAIGLKALKRLTTGHVHLVTRYGSPCTAFTQAADVMVHTAKGPHPISNPSLHIQTIAPIRKADDIVWTLSVADVIAVGNMIAYGKYWIDRVCALAGNGIPEEKRSFFRGRIGYPVENLIEGNKEPGLRLISGDPLNGTEVKKWDHLDFSDTVLSVIPENTTREAFHFLGLGARKYSATRAYASGHLRPPPGGYYFTTNQHGEERAFVDASLYQKVMPMRIPTMHLVKAILAENYELAVELGLLEIAPEDFALPTFIDPSKIEMVEIVKQGLHRYAHEMGY